MGSLKADGWIPMLCERRPALEFGIGAAAVTIRIMCLHYRILPSVTSAAYGLARTAS
jgi:hypothetical protein